MDDQKYKIRIFMWYDFKQIKTVAESYQTIFDVIGDMCVWLVFVW